MNCKHGTTQTTQPNNLIFIFNFVLLLNMWPFLHQFFVFTQYLAWIVQPNFFVFHNMFFPNLFQISICNIQIHFPSSTFWSPCSSLWPMNLYGLSQMVSNHLFFLNLPIFTHHLNIYLANYYLHFHILKVYFGLLCVFLTFKKHYSWGFANICIFKMHITWSSL